MYIGAERVQVICRDRWAVLEKMKVHLAILTVLFLNACWYSNQPKQREAFGNTKAQNANEAKLCEYIADFTNLGNSTVDTTRIGESLVDPIDDFSNFTATDFGFVQSEGRVYKKAKTHRECDGKFIDVEYYQEFTDRVELASYQAYNDLFFTTKGKVYFWWVNSDGHLIIPVNDADPKTFQPFENVSGGTDKNGVYYGCPDYGVYRLDLPKHSKFEFVAKENNYWNSPHHYVIVGEEVYDVKYELKRGYFCKLDTTVSVNEVLKLKK
ncbi:MAG: hypothetical protein AAFQ92_26510 [Bacteroidota bacterium]